MIPILFFIWVENQVSLESNETVKVKSRFEQWIWDQAAAKVYQYQGENVIFTATECQHNFNKKGKTLSFYGVSAQHQNTRPERDIKNVMYIMDRMFIINASLNWYKRGYDDIYLQYLSVIHLVWIYNRLPIKE